MLNLHIISAAALLASAALPALAAETRIAFSESAKAEVFAEHIGQSWCAETVRLRIVLSADSAMKPEEVPAFLKKLSTVFAHDCPTAVSAKVSTTKSGTAFGDPLTALKSEDWLGRPTSRTASDSPANPVPPSPLQPAAPPGVTRKVNVLPLNYAELLKRYHAANPQFAEDVAFLENYARHSACREWRQVETNEFKVKDFLESRKKHFMETIGKNSEEDLFNVFLQVPFGEYDSVKAEFLFRPIGPGSVIPKSLDEARRPPIGSGIPESCATGSNQFPELINVKIVNPWVIDGVPLPPSDAEKIVARHVNRYSRNFLMSLDLKPISIGKAFRDEGAVGRNSSIVTEVEVMIVGGSVREDRQGTATTVFSFTQDYLQERTARHEAIEKVKQEKLARLHQGSIPLTPEALEAAIPTVTPASPEALPVLDLTKDLLRIKVGRSFSTDQNGKISLGLKQDVNFFTDTKLPKLKFSNPDEYQSLTVPDEFKTSLEKNGIRTITHYLRPTGYVTDEWLGTYLMMYVARVDLELDDGRVWTPVAAAPAVPHNPLSDVRTAREIDILGVRGGMDLDDVRKIVGKELNQTLVFDEKTRVLSSPKEDCDFGFDVPKTKIGQKCFRAEFHETGRTIFFSKKYGLARAFYTQVLDRPSVRQAFELLRTKHGEPVGKVQTSHATLHSTVYHEGVSWGKRLTTSRLGMNSNLPIPVHALEVEAEGTSDSSFGLLTLTLTDGMKADAVNAEQAAKEKAAQEKPKTDVKL